MILRVLVVDAQSEFRRRLFTLLMTSLSDRVLHLKEAADTSAALELAKQEDFDLIFVDRALTELPTLLDTLHKTRPQAFVILCTETSDQDSLTLPQGAYDQVFRPPEAVQLARVVRSALQVRTLLKEVAFCHPLMEEDIQSDLSTSPLEMFSLCNVISHAAMGLEPVLIQGEEGTGKELLAQVIHLRSRLRHKPFVAVRCAPGGSLPPLFNSATPFSGTLFLNDLMDLSKEAQSLLLQHLKANKNGSSLRFICATRKSWEQEIYEGRFLADLIPQFATRVLFLPPLKERPEVIGPLSSYLLTKFQGKYNKAFTGTHPKTLEQLKSYDWPGNIRELYSTLEKACRKEKSSLLTPSSLPGDLFPSSHRAAKKVRQTPQLERERILSALRNSQGELPRAVAQTGLPRNLFLRKLRDFNIDLDQIAQKSAPR